MGDRGTDTTSVTKGGESMVKLKEGIFDGVDGMLDADVEVEVDAI